jgi:hypothetical protein
MKLIRIFVFVFSIWLSGFPAWCQSCPIAVRANVSIDKAEVTLADLLAPDSCLQALLAARLIHLGGAPLEGSARVLDSVEVRGLFQKLQSLLSVNSLTQDSPRLVFAHVPERVVIRRAHSQSLCHEIEVQILARPEIANLRSPIVELDCEAAGHIRQSASVTLTHKTWDPALQSWDFVAHCTHSGECMPFLVRVRSSRPGTSLYGATMTDSISPRSGTPTESSPENFLVRPGDRASVVWDQGGIRLIAPAICMDKGRRGDSVRARFEHGGVIRAIVVDSKSLRVQS